jgi:sulfoxide reductase heme-binding subunit YedZ
MTDAGTHIFWIRSRAAGITALVLASVAVCAGLALGGRIGVLRGRSAQLKTVHEALSLATLAALAVHGLALLGDGYLHPSLLDISVPFALGYRPLWTALGIVGGYGLAVLSLTYYARARIGVARWRRLHRFIALFWLLGVIHMLGAGTDAGQAWFLFLAAVVVLPTIALLALMFAGSGFPLSAGLNTVRPCRSKTSCRDARPPTSATSARRSASSASPPSAG